MCARCTACSSRFRISPRAATLRRWTRIRRGPGRARPRARRARRRRPQPVGASPASATAADLVAWGWPRRSRSRRSASTCATHEGVHPRVGAADVVPFVRFQAGDAEPEHAARLLGERDRRAGHPGARVRRPRRRAPAGVLPHGRRRTRSPPRLEAGEVEPLFGPAQLHPTAGAVLLGVRPPLVAFNLELDTGDVERGARGRRGRPGARRRPAGRAGARAATRAHRPRAGLDEPDRRRRDAASPGRRARSSGWPPSTAPRSRGGELVGLMPASVAAAAAGAALRLPGMAPDRILEIAAGGEFGRRRPVAFGGATWRRSSSPGTTSPSTTSRGSRCGGAPGRARARRAARRSTRPAR